MPTNLKTNSDLLQRLEQAAKHSVTQEELRRQRVSFIYGNLPNDSTITRHQIEQVIGRIEGVTEAA